MRRASLLIPIASALSLACGSPAPLEPAETGDLAATSEALGSSFTVMTVPSGASTVTGPSSASNVCWITRVAGNGVFALARLDNSGPNWILEGDPGIAATCVRMNWFQAPGPDRWYRNAGDGQLPSDTSDPDGFYRDGMVLVEMDNADPNYCGMVTAPLWNCDAASFITSVTLDANAVSSDNYVQVIDQCPVNSPGTAIGHQCGRTDERFYTQVSTGSIFVGTAGAGVAPAFGPNSFLVEGTSTSWMKTNMTSTSNSICYFIFLNGALQGSGDVAKIIESSGVWQLQAKSSTTDHMVGAVAQCFMRQQPS